MSTKNSNFKRAIKEYYKRMFGEYIAKMIEIKHSIYKKKYDDGFQHFYNSSINSFIFSEEEVKEIYEYVDAILISKYNLLIAVRMLGLLKRTKN